MVHDEILIKGDSLHLSPILIVWFTINCGGVQRQNYKTCLFVQNIMENAPNPRHPNMINV